MQPATNHKHLSQITLSASPSGGMIQPIVSAEKPDVQDGDQVIPIDLEALPWVSEQNGRVRSGVAYKASGLEVVSGPTALKAA